MLLVVIFSTFCAMAADGNAAKTAADGNAAEIVALREAADSLHSIGRTDSAAIVG